jgi:hypothetical protein
MATRLAAALTGLVLAGGSVIADSREAETCVVPTKMMPPVTVYRQPPPGPVELGPPVCVPGPKVFPAAVSPPILAESKPLPPVTLMVRVPQPVTLLAKTPSRAPLFRVEASPPVFVTKAAPPAPTVFAKHISAPESASGIVLPPVKVFRVTQPPACAANCAPGCQPTP